MAGKINFLAKVQNRSNLTAFVGEHEPTKERKFAASRSAQHPVFDWCYSPCPIGLRWPSCPTIKNCLKHLCWFRPPGDVIKPNTWNARCLVEPDQTVGIG